MTRLLSYLVLQLLQLAGTSQVPVFKLLLLFFWTLKFQ